LRVENRDLTTVNRHGGSEVSSEPAAQAVAVLRAQGSKRREAQWQKKMTRE
jgi:hypothetical protein